MNGKQDFKTRARGILDPAVALLSSLGVHPLAVSLFGLGLSLYGAFLLSEGSLFLSGIFLLLSGLCDVLDGDLARRRNVASRFGAFIDSTLDRVTEFAYFGGIILYLVNRPNGFHNYEIIVVFVALAGSVLTSYTRARAEGIGCECKVGIMERPERIALLVLGLFLGYRVLIGVMTILAVTSMYTFIQRVLHVHRVTTAEDKDAAQPPVETGPALVEDPQSDPEDDTTTTS